MKRPIVTLLVLLALGGCDASNTALKVGDLVTFKTSPNSGGKVVLAADEGVLQEMAKPSEEYAKIVDQLFADKRFFEENESSRATVISTGQIKGKNIARVRIEGGLNPGREAWAFTMHLVRAK